MADHPFASLSVSIQRRVSGEPRFLHLGTIFSIYFSYSFMKIIREALWHENPILSRRC